MGFIMFIEKENIIFKQTSFKLNSNDSFGDPKEIVNFKFWFFLLNFSIILSSYSSIPIPISISVVNFIIPQSRYHPFYFLIKFYLIS
jgi:hypothetical protein